MCSSNRQYSALFNKDNNEFKCQKSGWARNQIIYKLKPNELISVLYQ